jgi:tetratricopeptide (TPR) repeat protein
MSNINTWAAVLLVSWTLQAGAEDASYDKDGLKFSGSAEAVKAFKEAATAYDEADRVEREIREQNLPYNDQRAGEARTKWYSTREAMYKAALELKLTPGTANSSDMQGVDMLSTRRDVHALGRFMEHYQEKCADNPARYVVWLKKMLPAWKGCAGEADILLVLGRLHENDPAIALTYYDRAAKDACDVDQFQFRRQQAWQGVARMCEKLGKYQEALAALKNWEIREPCGNGANSSRIQRMFWMWRLRRLSGEDPMALRRELVQALKTDDWMISPAEREIIAFYGTDKAALRQDTLAVLETFEESTEEDKKRHDYDIKVLKAIITLLDQGSMDKVN